MACNDGAFARRSFNLCAIQLISLAQVPFPGHGFSFTASLPHACDEHFRPWKACLCPCACVVQSKLIKAQRRGSCSSSSQMLCMAFPTCLPAACLPLYCLLPQRCTNFHCYCNCTCNSSSSGSYISDDARCLSFSLIFLLYDSDKEQCHQRMCIIRSGYL